MFKLFKDLTRPPERLDQPSSAPQTPPVSAPSSLGYAARQRNRSVIPPLDGQAPPPAAAQNGGASAQPPPAAREVEEEDVNAIKVVEYLRGLDSAENVMSVVEVSSSTSL